LTIQNLLIDFNADIPLPKEEGLIGDKRDAYEQEQMKQNLSDVSCTAKIQGERLDITVNSVEFGGQILPVELTVYDLDGQRGIFIPNLQELSAAKEIVANMGTSASTSINLSNDAGEQFVADMGRNLIQGVSQFAAKKLREVKVHLKSGYRLYLVSEELLKQKNNQILANK
jgi:conjugative transposon TraM protein